MVYAIVKKEQSPSFSSLAAEESDELSVTDNQDDIEFSRHLAITLTTVDLAHSLVLWIP